MARQGGKAGEGAVVRSEQGKITEVAEMQVDEEDDVAENVVDLGGAKAVLGNAVIRRVSKILDGSDKVPWCEDCIRCFQGHDKGARVKREVLEGLHYLRGEEIWVQSAVQIHTATATTGKRRDALLLVPVGEIKETLVCS
jgi:hypothetical protein